MRFGSVCSGIEAASVAWHDLGWRAAWLAEIDKFASAVLAHHYPDVPNLGDMTKIARAILTGEICAPDVLCGGTPCQAFSVAGLRESLADARGNLTLKFVEIANAIDHVRTGRGEDECIVFWENVPGVLSTKDNAFGCFLAGLAGEDEPLVPPGQTPKPDHPGKWANAGAVYGPRRAVAWRTLDAQYFGVAQRRRRVFVVASARKGFDPAQVLFEWDGVRRDTTPSREARQTAPTIPARSSAGGGLGTDFDCDGGLIAGTLQAGGKAAGSATQQDAESGLLLPVAFGGNRTSGAIDITPALLAQPGSGYKNDFESETFLVQPARTLLGKANCSHAADKETYVTHSLRGEGFDASEDGTGRGTPLVPVAYATKLHNTSSNQAGKFYENYTASLDANSPPPAIVFDTTQVPCTVGTLTANGDAHSGFKDERGLVPVAYTPEVAATMVARSSRGGGQTNSPGHQADSELVASALQVRRLTPTECERLQGFPDGYTNIPWRTFQEASRKGLSYETLLAQRGMTLRGPSVEECPDGPRYKALGNSWAIPNAAWIGRRIANALCSSCSR